MKNHLWKEIIEESGYEGVSIPYMVGKFYQKGVISEEDLQTNNCIKTILTYITSNTITGNEPAILLCDTYRPYIPMIQTLNSMGRTEQDIQTIIANNPSIKNSDGDVALYLQIGESADITLDDIVAKYWGKYGGVIKEHRFSVESAFEIQTDGTYHIWRKFED